MEKEKIIKKLVIDFYLNCLHEKISDLLELNNERIKSSNKEIEQIKTNIKELCSQKNGSEKDIDLLLDELSSSYYKILFETKKYYFLYSFMLGLSLTSIVKEYSLSDIRTLYCKLFE